MNEPRAETAWTHIFRSMVRNDLKTMGTDAFSVYCIIKVHSSFSTGKAFPTIEQIADQAGLSSRHVIKCLKVLEEMGYITKEKVWKSNVYTLREKIHIESNGEQVAVATWDYIPNAVEAARAELKNFLMTGETGTIVHIENLTITNPVIIQGDMININADQIADPKLRDTMNRPNDTLVCTRSGSTRVRATTCRTLAPAQDPTGRHDQRMERCGGVRERTDQRPGEDARLREDHGGEV